MTEYELKPFGDEGGEWTLRFIGGPADGKEMEAHNSMPFVVVIVMDGGECRYHCVDRNHEGKTAEYLLDA